MFLITRPSHDITTHYLYFWSDEIIDTAKKKNKRVVDLKKDKAIKSKVESYLKKQPIRLVMFNGHGSEDSVAGHQDQVLIKSSKNEKLLSSKIVYCRSCKSGKKLAPDSIISCADAFIGYDDDFIFYYDDNMSSRPLNDKTAAQFLKPTNKIITSLLKGHSVEDALKKSEEEFNKNIQNLVTSDTSESDMSSLRFLIWDKAHQTYHGDGQATY